jgi:hypothetical protein
MARAPHTDDSAEGFFDKDVDWHLRLLVEDANDFGVELPITLFVAGGVVTGVLTGGKEYFERFADQFAAGWPAEGREALRASMAAPGSAYPRLEPGEKSPRKEPALYIHLRDAHLVGVQGHLPASREGLLWRGRLCAVAGYSLGRVNNSPATDVKVARRGLKKKPKKKG